MKKMNKKGFTLVEIMIVVAIIGLLAAIGIPSFQKARTNAIEKTKLSNARTLAATVEMYATENAKSADGDSVDQTEINNYLKGGWYSLNISGTAATWPGDTLGNFNKTVEDLANNMYK